LSCPVPQVSWRPTLRSQLRSCRLLRITDGKTWVIARLQRVELVSRADSLEETKAVTVIPSYPRFLKGLSGCGLGHTATQQPRMGHLRAETVRMVPIAARVTHEVTASNASNPDWLGACHWRALLQRRGARWPTLHALVTIGSRHENPPKIIHSATSYVRISARKRSHS